MSTEKDDNLRPLPVDYPYCCICLNFEWSEKGNIYWKDIKDQKPLGCYNRFIPLGKCLKRGKRVSAFATCNSWQDDA